MIRAKEVVIINIEGAKVNMVKRNKTCKALETFSGSSASSIPNWIDGRETASEEGTIHPKKNVAVNIRKNIFFVMPLPFSFFQFFVKFVLWHRQPIFLLLPEPLKIY